MNNVQLVSATHTNQSGTKKTDATSDLSPNGTPTSASVSGSDLFIWDYSGSLKAGESLELKVSGNLDAEAKYGEFINTAYVLDPNNYRTSNTKESETSIGYDVDSNAGTDNDLMKATSGVYTTFVKSVDSIKYVNGELDADGLGNRLWKKKFDDPVDQNYGRVLPGGIADYKIKVDNSGSNGPISNIIIVDRLPFIGDTGLIDTTERGSQWKPYLINEFKITTDDINAGEGKTGTVIAYYSTVANPDLSKLYDPLNGTISSDWSTTPPDDITTVTHLLFDLDGYVLDKNDYVEMQWEMRAPVGAPTDKFTMNSFAYSATYPDEGGQENFLPAEPAMVQHKIVTSSGTYNLGNFIWHDLDKDGIQDVGEPGINGILVNLYDHTDTLIKHTRTGELYNADPSATPVNGYYTFPNLSDGNYKVEFVLDDSWNYYPTPGTVGADTTIDSNVTAAPTSAGGFSSYIVPVTINAADDMSVDFGLYKKARIGNYVWKDLNGNGIQDDSNNPNNLGVEVGMNGVEVKLLDASDDSVLATATTGSGSWDPGEYYFENIDPGLYKLQFTKPADYFTTQKDQGADDKIDSDIDTVSTTTDAFRVYSEDENLTFDAGFHKAFIGDYVWEDRDMDGGQDESSSYALGNVTVKLYKKTDLATAIMTTQTESNGYYHFADLGPDEYVVEFGRISDYILTDKNLIVDTAKDSDVIATTYKTDVINLAASEINKDIDAGYYRLSS